MEKLLYATSICVVFVIHRFKVYECTPCIVIRRCFRKRILFFEKNIAYLNNFDDFNCFLQLFRNKVTSRSCYNAPNNSQRCV